MRSLLSGAGKPLFVVLLAVVLMGVATVGLGQRPRGQDTDVAGARTSADALPVAAAQGSLEGTISSLQQRLKILPGDARGWATLGLAYVEQARVTVQSSYYPKAEQALERGSSLAPRDDLVLAGQAALASARHDFGAALRQADAALAANPYSSLALSIRADALTELGRYDEALAAARKADETKPGTSTFARLSYAQELRGDTDGAMTLMKRAAEAAASPTDAAFAYYQLGELDRRRGRYMSAANFYDRALRAAPQDVASRAGKARLLAAQGEHALAIDAFEDVVERLPLPEYVIELGELYEASGRMREAEGQYAVVRAGSAIAKADGVNVDLETAYFEADHGDPAAAVTAAEAEWKKRRSIAVADALGWALHAAGHDRRAMSYAEQATRLGTKDALFLYHRGVIELALGRNRDAIRSLRSALEIDPRFSPLHAGHARAALARAQSGLPR